MLNNIPVKCKQVSILMLAFSVWECRAANIQTPFLLFTRDIQIFRFYRWVVTNNEQTSVVSGFCLLAEHLFWLLIGLEAVSSLTNRVNTHTHTDILLSLTAPPSCLMENLNKRVERASRERNNMLRNKKKTKQEINQIKTETYFLSKTNWSLKKKLISLIELSDGLIP